MRVLLTARAEQHLDDLHTFISVQSSERRADTYVGRILDYCARLAVFPNRGTRRDDLLPGLRTMGFERRVTIAFVVLDDRVLIEGVFYGGRDIDAAFASD